MALITKTFTFSAGATIVAAEHNTNFDTLYNDYNGNITNANVASGAAIVDTKLAQITTANKVSGAALTSLGSIPSASDTTTNSLAITADSLTSGIAALITSNSSDTTSRSVVKIVNDHTAATGAKGLTIQQDSTANALYINYTATVSDSVTGIRIDGCDVANGSGTVTISNVAPAGVGTATISRWLVVDVAGTRYYMPLWT